MVRSKSHHKLGWNSFSHGRGYALYQPDSGSGRYDISMINWLASPQTRRLNVPQMDLLKGLRHKK